MPVEVLIIMHVKYIGFENMNWIIWLRLKK
jgi:hypothetical protein